MEVERWCVFGYQRNDELLDRADESLQAFLEVRVQIGLALAVWRDRFQDQGRIRRQSGELFGPVLFPLLSCASVGDRELIALFPGRFDFVPSETTINFQLGNR